MKKVALICIFCSTLPGWAAQPWLFGAAVRPDPSTFRLDVINYETEHLHGSIPVSSLSTRDYGSLQAIAVHPKGNIAYVLEDAAAGNGQTQKVVKVVCLLTNQILATIPLGAPGFFRDQFVGHQLAIAPNGNYLYVATDDPIANVYVVSTSTNKVAAKILLNSSYWAAQLWITPDGKYLYMNINGVVAVIATATNRLIANIETGVSDPYPEDFINSEQHTVMTPSGAQFYISDPVSGRIVVISTTANRVTGVIPLPDPLEMTVTPDGTQLWATINADSWTQVEGGFGISPTYNSKISIVDTATANVIDTFPDPALSLPPGPSYTFDMVFTPDGKSLYFLVSIWDTTIYILDAETKRLGQRISFDAGHHLVGLLAPR